MLEPVTPNQHRNGPGAGPVPERRHATRDIATVIAGLLRDVGIRRALQYLNARTRYRFTGIYHVEPPVLRNICLFDRENPTLDCSGAVTRLDETYCSITSSRSAPFATADASRDPRLRDHAARESVLCYSGVPIRLPSGATWGTLCHFDLRPRLMAETEIAVLEAVMPVFEEWISAREDQPHTA
jgi:GAF domain-containing protein